MLEQTDNGGRRISQDGQQDLDCVATTVVEAAKEDEEEERDPWGEGIFATAALTCIPCTTWLFPILCFPLPALTVPKATGPSSQKSSLPMNIPEDSISPAGADRGFRIMSGRLIHGVRQDLWIKLEPSP